MNKFFRSLIYIPVEERMDRAIKALIYISAGVLVLTLALGTVLIILGPPSVQAEWDR